MLGGVGPTELIIILLIILVLFGGKKIPEIARGLGKGIREFKDAQAGVDSSAPKQAAPEKIEDQSNKPAA